MNKRDVAIMVGTVAAAGAAIYLLTRRRPSAPSGSVAATAQPETEENIEYTPTVSQEQIQQAQQVSQNTDQCMADCYKHGGSQPTCAHICYGSGDSCYQACVADGGDEDECRQVCYPEAPAPQPQPQPGTGQTNQTPGAAREGAQASTTTSTRPPMTRAVVPSDCDEARNYCSLWTETFCGEPGQPLYAVNPLINEYMSRCPYITIHRQLRYVDAKGRPCDEVTFFVNCGILCDHVDEHPGCRDFMKYCRPCDEVFKEIGGSKPQPTETKTTAVARPPPPSNMTGEITSITYRVVTPNPRFPNNKQIIVTIVARVHNPPRSRAVAARLYAEIRGSNGQLLRYGRLVTKPIGKGDYTLSGTITVNYSCEYPQTWPATVRAILYAVTDRDEPVDEKVRDLDPGCG